MQVNLFGFPVPAIIVATAVVGLAYTAVVTCSLIAILWAGSGAQHECLCGKKEVKQK